MTTINVQYIGSKSVCHDSVAHTGLTWTPGQVHAMDRADAEKLLRYTDTWVRPANIAEGSNAWAASYSVAQAADASDKIVLGVVPAGVTVDFARLIWEDAGTGVTLDVGFEPLDGETPEAVGDYWFDGQDVATAAGNALSAAVPVTFSAPVNLVATVLGAALTETPRFDVALKGSIAI